MAMVTKRGCYLLALTLTFTVSLVGISLISASEELGYEEDLVISAYSQEAWKLFLARREVDVPSLITSIVPWNSTGKALIQLFPALLQYPTLPYDSVPCLPRIFGYTQEQADALFSPTRTYPSCGDPLAASLHVDRK
jgi:hypothetical protein